MQSLAKNGSYTINKFKTQLNFIHLFYWQLLNILIFVKIQQNLASFNLFNISSFSIISFGIIHKSTITSAICLNQKQEVKGRL